MLSIQYNLSKDTRFTNILIEKYNVKSLSYPSNYVGFYQKMYGKDKYPSQEWHFEEYFGINKEGKDCIESRQTLEDWLNAKMPSLSCGEFVFWIYEVLETDEQLLEENFHKIVDYLSLSRNHRAINSYIRNLTKDRIRELVSLYKEEV